MDEKKTDEEKKSEAATGNSNVGVSAKEKRIQDLLDRTTQATEDLKVQNKEKRELIDAEKEIQAKREIGGMSEAGSEQKSQYSDEEKATRKRIKAVADVSGSSWGKKYE